MKPGKLTLALLLGKKGKSDGEDEDENEDENEDEGRVPPDFLDAIAQFRSAEDDTSAAKCLYRALEIFNSGE